MLENNYNFELAISEISEVTFINEGLIQEIIELNIPLSTLENFNSSDELVSYLSIFEDELRYEQRRYLIN